MAKNQHSQNSSGEREEHYIAISWPAHSLMSSSPAPAPPQTFPVSATTSHAFRLKAAARQLSGTSGEVIPIEIDPHLLPTVHKFNKKTNNYPDSFRNSTGQLTKVSSKIEQEAAPTYLPVQHQMNMRTQETMNDRFTAYISRVKHAMLKTLSNVGSAEISSEHENFDDNVWINDNSSAQMKIKNSSSIVGGNNVTFK